jgi:hypothetical protein
MGKVRGVRFSEDEETLIEEFLSKNTLLDFSTLAKVAILEFIKKPQINLTPVGTPSRKESRDVRPLKHS